MNKILNDKTLNDVTFGITQKKCTFCNVMLAGVGKIIRIKHKEKNVHNDVNANSSLSTIIFPYNKLSPVCSTCIAHDSYEMIFDMLEKHKISFDAIDYNFTYFTCDNNIYVLKKEWRNFVRNNLNVGIRKNKLFKRLCEEKLQYKKNGICDAYIKHGKLDIDDVIHSLKHTNNCYNERMHQLLDALKNHSITYDSTVPVFKKYLEGTASSMTLMDVVREGEVEKKLMLKTNFSDLMKVKDYDEAKEMSLLKYKKTSKLSTLSVLTLKFD